MADILINGKKYTAALTELPESLQEESKKIDKTGALDENSRVSLDKVIKALDQPFQDEVLLKIQPSKGAPAKYYVARLAASTPSDSFSGKKIEIVGSDKKIEATVVRILNDEVPGAQYKITSVDVTLGALLPDGSLAETKSDQLPKDIEGLKKKFLETLNTKTGQKLNIGLYGTLSLKDIQELTAPEGRLDQLENVLPEVAMDTGFHFQWNADRTGLEISFLITPPPPKLHLHVTDSKTLKDPEKKALFSEISFLLRKIAGKPTTPTQADKPYLTFDKKLTKEQVLEFKKELTKLFEKNPQFYLAPLRAPDGRFLDETIAFSYNAQGELNCVINPLSLPTKAEVVQVIHSDSGQKPIELKIPQDKIPFKVITPLNPENNRLTLENMKDYYAEKGLFIKDYRMALTSAGVAFHVNVMSAPKSVQLKGDHGPSQGDLNKMFLDADLGLVTNKSFEEGIKKLDAWYQEQGLALGTITTPQGPKREPAVIQLNSSGLVLEAHPRILKSVTIKYINGEDKTEVLELTPENLEKYNFLKELDLIPGQPLNLKKLRESLARIKSKTTVDAFESKPFAFGQPSKDQPLELPLEIYLYDRSMVKHPKFGGNLRASIGGGVTLVEGQEPMGNFDLSLGYKFLDGEIVNLAYSFIGNDLFQAHQAGGGVYLPWLNNNGLALSIQTGVSFVQSQGSEKIHLSQGTELTQPVAKHSPWAWVAGLGTTSVIQDAEYDRTFIRPAVGMQYTDESHRLKLTTGPVLTEEGDFAWKLNLKHFSRFDLPKGFFIDVNTSLGSLFLVDGHLPLTELLGGSDMTLGYGPMMSPAAFHQASLRADIMWRAASWFNLGLGTSGQVMDRVTGIDSQGDYISETYWNVGGGARFDVLLGGANLMFLLGVQQDNWLPDPQFGFALGSPF